MQRQRRRSILTARYSSIPHSLSPPPYPFDEPSPLTPPPPSSPAGVFAHQREPHPERSESSHPFAAVVDAEEWTSYTAEVVGHLAVSRRQEPKRPHPTLPQLASHHALSSTAASIPLASLPLTVSRPSTLTAWREDQCVLAMIEWRLVEAAHAREVDALIADLQSVGDDAALHAMLISRLRLCEVAFATRRRRMIGDTANSMRRRAQLRTLRASISGWKRVTGEGQRRDRMAEEWSAAELRQRAAARRCVARWWRWVQEDRACALLQLRRESRLQRALLEHWQAAFQLCQAQWHLALLVDRRRCRRLLHHFISHWQQRASAAARHRLLASLELQWQQSRRRRLQRWIVLRWGRWCSREAECRGRVAVAMSGSGQNERRRVRPGLWQVEWS